jgi:hypothetical protein
MTNQTRYGLPRIALLAAILCVISGPIRAQFGPPPPVPPSNRQNAPWDPSGYWVAIVSEDWRFRMLTPGKGEFPGVPLNDVGKKLAEAWDPARDEAAGQQCKYYGAASIMRVPGRIRISWVNDTTLKIEADAGTQTRLLHFDGAPSGSPSLQGWSAAAWEPLMAGGLDPPKFVASKAVTTRLQPGYLRRNGVPYSANATVTEYFDVLNDPNARETWLMVKTVVDDPTYLLEPFITSTNFKKQPDGGGWSPSACSAR